MPVLQTGLAKSADAAYTIDQSLRFEKGDSTYLSRTPTVAGNRKTWTWSGWVKKVDNANTSWQALWTAWTGTSTISNGIWIDNQDVITFYFGGSGYTAQVFRDNSSWYHFVFVLDTTQSTDTDRFKIWVNGEQITSFVTTVWPVRDTDYGINNTVNHSLGCKIANSSAYMSMYLAEVYFIDGTALDASSFGETDTATNQWKPIDASGLTFGTNGFYQKYSSTELAASFEDSSTLHSIHTVTAGGNAHTDTSVKKFGTASLQLDGTGDYLSVSNNNDFNLGTGDFTIDCWVRSSDFVPGTDAGVIIHLKDSGSSDFRLVMGSGGRAAVGQDYGMSWGYNNGGSWSTTAYGADLADGAWHHVACSRQGSYFYLFQDGVLVSTTVGWAGLNITGNATCQIGRRQGGQDYFEGYIDELRVSKGIARWTDDFTVESSAYTADEYTALLLHMDGSDSGTTFTDSSWASTSSYLSGRHTITANGDAKNVRSVGNFQCDYLVVAGGGAGGRHSGGGGGAGGMLAGTTNIWNGVSYAITVGDGGAANTSGAASAANDGDDSVFSTITSTGGGAGAVSGAGGRSGGSGGGDAGWAAAGSGTSGQGNAGGGNAAAGTGSGGGGKNAAGTHGGNSAGGVGGPGGAGGAGTASSITGTSVTYAGGGGGGTNSGSAVGAGGAGGGGNGGNTSGGPGSDGTDGLGGGGGGSATVSDDSGAGGSGIVIIRYKSATNLATGGAITTDGDYKVHTFTADGTFTITGATRPGDSSIKFDGTDDYLEIADSSDFDFGTGDFCVEMWLRPTAGTDQFLYSHYGEDFYVETDNRLRSDLESANYTPVDSLTNDAWQHVALVRHSATLYMFIGGVSQTSWSSTTDFDSANQVRIGRRQDSQAAQLDGYIDEYRISNVARYPDGTTFTPSTTAFTADSNTMLLIHSDYTGGLGADSSGNKNDFTPTNLVATDQMVDSPTNNFATLNPLVPPADTGSIFSEGNLKYRTYKTGGDNVQGEGTIGFTSGKWYWEIYLIGFEGSTARRGGIGVGDPISNEVWTTACTEAAVVTIGNLNPQSHNVVAPSTGDSWSVGAAGDIWCCAFDADAGTFIITKNTALTGSETTGKWTGFATSTVGYRPITVEQSGSDYTEFVYNFGQDSSFAGNTTAQGNQDSNDIGDFYYEPPTDYLALCTSNLASPEIALPGDNFNTVLYTGDNTTGRGITGVGFSPGFLWIKNRDANDNFINVDSVRGPTIYWSSNTGGTFTTDSNMVTSLDSDGFTIGDEVEVNTNTENFVSWNWLCGDSFDPTTGSTVVTATGNANTTAGISVVKYLGPGGSTDTFAHGLSLAPSLVIIKADAGDAAIVGSDQLASWTGGIRLSTTNAVNDADTYWRDLAPTASLVRIGTAGDVNDGGGTTSYSAYCFHDVEGYSKVGSYTGNGNADGPFIYTGFRPAWILVKNSTASGNSWDMWDNKRDTYNVMNHLLQADNSGARITSAEVDFVSDGFKVRSTSDAMNDSGETLVYLAFAESPFKYSNAR